MSMVASLTATTIFAADLCQGVLIVNEQTTDLHSMGEEQEH